MDKRKRRMAEGWIEKAGNQLETAKGHLNSYMQFSECIQASQQCIELCVKAILLLVGIEYGSSHGLDPQQLSNVAKQIQGAGLLDKLTDQNLAHIRLPRLLFLSNFWAQFYLTAKYGFQSGYLAAPKDLFDREEAALSVHHANECFNAALQFKCLDDQKLASLISSNVLT